MMTNFKQIWVLAVMLSISFISHIALAYDFEADGVYYTIISASEFTVEVSGANDSITEIVIPQEVEYKGRQLEVIGIEDKAFEKSEIESISLPSSIQYIGDKAFYQSEKLRSINLPNSIQSIGYEAFCQCVSLESVVNIPDNVTVGTVAFESCSSLQSVNISENVTLGSGAFENCYSLQSVNISENVTLGGGAFESCSSLQSVNISENVTLGGGAFESCSSLKSVNIPDNVTLSSYVFNDCDSLAEVTLGRVTSIGSYAFARTAISKINLPETLESIGQYCFFNCKRLKSLDIPSSCTEIGICALCGCDSLETLKIGSGLDGLPYAYSYDGGYMRYEYTTLFVSTRELGYTHKNLREFIIEDCNKDFSIKGDYIRHGKYDEPVPILWGEHTDYCYVGRPLIDIWGPSYDYDASEVGSIHKLEIGGGCTEVPRFYQNVDTLVLGASVLRFSMINIETDSMNSIICKGTVPPEITDYEDGVSESIYADINVYVPKGSKQAYLDAEVWKKFWNIIEYDALGGPADIMSVCDDDSVVRIIANGGVLKILNKPANVVCHVYNLQGNLVLSTKDDVVSTLAKGVYIVKVGNETKKIIL